VGSASNGGCFGCNHVIGQLKNRYWINTLALVSKIEVNNRLDAPS
jgi:hypothetical protein